MTGGHWILLQETDGLRLGKVSDRAELHQIAVSPDALADDIASAVSECMGEHGYRGEPLILGVHSRTCLATSIPHGGRRNAGNHRTMAIALEEFMPAAAEDMVCDFVVFDSDALGVAVEVSRLRHLLSALEGESVPVVSIVPTAMLVLQNVLGKAERKGRQVITW